MRKTLDLSTLLATAGVVLLLTFAPVSKARQEPDVGHSRAGLPELWSLLDELWNERDAEAFSDTFTADASFQFVDRGYALESRDAILEHFSMQFPRIAPDVRHLTTVNEIRDIAPGVCTIDGTVMILRGAAADGAAETRLRRFAVFAVMQRADDQWRIRVLRAFEMPLGADEAVVPRRDEARETGRV